MTTAVSLLAIENQTTQVADDAQTGLPHRNVSDGIGRLPEVTLAMAVAGGIVAVAFAAARSGHHWASHLFWVGQVAIYAVPAGFLLCRKHVLRLEAMGLALVMPVITFLVNQYYSPGQFRFTDEFDHVQTAQTILATHHLFHANTVLPQSAQYPGLEIITTAIVSVTHLSITTSGLIVVGAAHVLVGLGLYLLITEMTGRYRVAALAGVIYATGSHYQFFDSYFIYEAIALPFLLLSLLATIKMVKRQGSVAVAWGVAAVAFGAVTAVCHHVTSYMLVALLFAFAAAQLWFPSPRRTRGLITVLISVAAIVAIWDLGIATATVSYFRPVIDSLVPGRSTATTAVGGVVIATKAGVTGKSPRIDTIAEYIAFLVLMALTFFGTLSVWRIRRTFTNPGPLGLAIGSLSIVLVLAIRVAVPSGSELASRGLTFALIPISFVSATLLVDWAVGRASPKHRRHGGKWRIGYSSIGALLVVVLAVGNIASGWPAFYARLPGPYLVSAWERSVDQHNVSAAQWVADALPRDQGVASDYSTEAVISALGHQADVQGIAGLFLTLKYSSSQGALARSKRVSYIAVDRRVSQQLPATGYYFKQDPERGLYSTPLPAQALDKFEKVPGVSRIFDDGTIVIYQIIGSAYTK